MPNKKIKLDFKLSFKDIVDLNKSFAKAKCLIAYAGRNRNKSDISEETFEKALCTIKNIPLVGRYDEKKNVFGSHDIKVIKKDETYEIVNATTPFGVVPESANQWWEDQEVDGEVKHCLYTDILLWKRQYGYEHIKEKGTLDQSMEINVESYDMDKDNYCVIKDFQFEALCLLESDEPCFENASVQVFSNEICNNFKLQFSEMISELKELDLGGAKLDKQEILEKYHMQESDLNFSIDEMSAEDLESKPKEILEEKTKAANSFSRFKTYEEKKQALKEKFKDDVRYDDDGEITQETHRWLLDFTDKHVYVGEYQWSKDNYSEAYYRYSYIWNEENKTVEISDEKEKIYHSWLTSEEKDYLDTLEEKHRNLNDEYSLYKEEHSHSNDDYKKLEDFKETALKEKLNIELDKVLKKYEKQLGNLEEFKLLKKNKGNYTVDTLEKECIYIRGLHSTNFGINKDKNGTISFSVEGKEAEDEKPYGDIFDLFG